MASWQAGGINNLPWYDGDVGELTGGYIYRHCSPVRFFCCCGCVTVRLRSRASRPLPPPSTMRPPIAALLTPPTNRYRRRRHQLKAYIFQDLLPVLGFQGISLNDVCVYMPAFGGALSSLFVYGSVRAMPVDTGPPARIGAKGTGMEDGSIAPQLPFPPPRTSTFSEQPAHALLCATYADARFVDDVAVRAQRIAREITKDGTCAVVSGIVMASLTTLSHTLFLPRICPTTLLGCYAPPSVPMGCFAPFGRPDNAIHQ